MTSQQGRLEQKRANAAWQAIHATNVGVKARGKEFENKYKPLAGGGASDIQSIGLGQTLAFWRAKGKEHHLAIYGHLSGWVKQQMNLGADVDLRDWVAQSATTTEYSRATVEALAFLSWLKRFAEADLEGEIQGKGE